MFKSNKFYAFITLLSISVMNPGYAASVGPYVIADNNFVNGITAAEGIYGTSFDDITDMSVDTYVYVSTSATVPGSLTLTFPDHVINGAGDDVALFFLDPGDVTPEVTSITMGGTTLDGSYIPDQLFQTNGDKYMVQVGEIWYDLTAITLEAANFGLADGDVLGSISVTMQPGSYLALVGGFNSTAVPIPAPLVLFLSGIGSLIIIGRRRNA